MGGRGEAQEAEAEVAAAVAAANRTGRWQKRQGRGERAGGSSLLHDGDVHKAPQPPRAVQRAHRGEAPLLRPAWTSRRVGRTHLASTRTKEQTRRLCAFARTRVCLKAHSPLESLAFGRVCACARVSACGVRTLCANAYLCLNEELVERLAIAMVGVALHELWQAKQENKRRRLVR